MSGKQKMSAMLKVLKAENAVLDSILVRQAAIHDTVAAKDWIDLEDSMKKMDRLSSRFLELEDKRMNLEMETAVKMRGLDKQDEKIEDAQLENESSNIVISSSKEVSDNLEYTASENKDAEVKDIKVEETIKNPYDAVFFIKRNDLVSSDEKEKLVENVSEEFSSKNVNEESKEDSLEEPLVLTYEERAFLYGEKKVSDVFSQVRTKLARSKIENNALRIYVAAANGFLQGVLDKIVPQRRNTVYNRYGKMAKPNVQSLVIDKVF